jgi:hypothetical protein
MTILSVESASGNISRHSFSLSLSKSIAGLVMAFSLMELCFSPSARALALFNFQSIYLDLRSNVFIKFFGGIKL